MAECLPRREPCTHCRLVLPARNRRIGSAEHLRNVCAEQQRKGDDGKNGAVHRIHIIVKKRKDELRRTVEDDEQQNDGRRTAHHIHVGERKRAQHAAAAEIRPCQQSAKQGADDDAEAGNEQCDVKIGEEIGQKLNDLPEVKDTCFHRMPSSSLFYFR